MIDSIHVSLAALVISIAGFSVSAYSVFRDRGRLRTNAILYADEHGLDEPSLRIEAVNGGRRPLVLRMWGGSDNRGEYVGTYIDREIGGKRLGENERVEFNLRRSDLGCHLGGDVIDFTRLWFEDSLGRRFEIKGSREQVEKCKAAWDRYREVSGIKNDMRKMVRDEVRNLLERGGASG